MNGIALKPKKAVLVCLQEMFICFLLRFIILLFFPLYNYVMTHCILRRFAALFLLWKQQEYPPSFLPCLLHKRCRGANGTTFLCVQSDEGGKPHSHNTEKQSTNDLVH